MSNWGSSTCFPKTSQKRREKIKKRFLILRNMYSRFLYACVLSWRFCSSQWLGQFHWWNILGYFATGENLRDNYCMNCKIQWWKYNLEFVLLATMFSVAELSSLLPSFPPCIPCSTWLWNTARGMNGEEVQGRLLPKSHGSGKTFPGPRALRTIASVKTCSLKYYPFSYLNFILVTILYYLCF